MLDAAHVAENLKRIHENIAEAAARVRREPGEITLVAVSKTWPLELTRQAYKMGETQFGENRIQDALPKIAAFRPENLRWHMIGHLQSNKARKAVEAFDLIQTLDSLHLAQLLEQYAAELGRRLPVLLQVNVSGEASKEGVSPEKVPELARQVLDLPHLEVQGLMTIAPRATTPEEVRPVFQGLRELRDKVRVTLPQSSWQHLSMGMTDDYTVAIEEGATIIRIGRAIFGERELK